MNLFSKMRRTKTWLKPNFISLESLGLMQSVIQKLLALIGLLSFSALCAYFGLADFYYQRAKDHYRVLGQSQLSSVKDLNSVMVDVDRSLAVRGSYADALDLKADLLYKSWWLSPDGQYLHQSDYLQEAVRLHLRALKVRKGWVFAISRLALIHSHQQVLDEKFHHWFFESHRLGLNETLIARSLMEVGLLNWERLTYDQRTITLDFIRVSIEQKANSPQSISMVLRRYQKREYVCRELPDSPRKITMCMLP